MLWTAPRQLMTVYLIRHPLPNCLLLQIILLALRLGKLRRMMRSLNYMGPLYVIISSNDNNNIRNLHPVEIGKMFIKHFNGVTNITPIGSHRVKITFNYLHNTNACLNSLFENNYFATMALYILILASLMKISVKV